MDRIQPGIMVGLLWLRNMKLTSEKPSVADKMKEIPIVRQCAQRRLRKRLAALYKAKTNRLAEVLAYKRLHNPIRIA
jgi:hypothetical protein